MRDIHVALIECAWRLIARRSAFVLQVAVVSQDGFELRVNPHIPITVTVVWRMDVLCGEVSVYVLERGIENASQLPIEEGVVGLGDEKFIVLGLRDVFVF